METLPENLKIGLLTVEKSEAKFFSNKVLSKRFLSAYRDSIRFFDSIINFFYLVSYRFCIFSSLNPK
jgi:hypothetical protein